MNILDIADRCSERARIAQELAATYQAGTLSLEDAVIELGKCSEVLNDAAEMIERHQGADITWGEWD